MTKNNFKIAFRVLWRDRFNSVINLLSLTIGLTCLFLLGSYVSQELSFDQFHSKKANIYRVWLKEDYGNDKVFFNSRTPILFESLLEENFQQIKSAIQIDIQNFTVGSPDEPANENIAIISPEFFTVFDFNIVNGNQSAPLASKNDIIMTESYAKKYFGQENPMGKSILMQINGESRAFQISAIIEDFKENSSIRFNMGISNKNNLDIYGERAMTAWFNVSQETYVLIDPKATIASVEDNIQNVVMARLKDQVNPGEYNIGFQPLTAIHLDASVPVGIAPVGNKEYVYILAAISILVLIIACINYTTLSIGQSLRRRKEVGVRKVMGALKSSLVNQYLSESIILTTIATLIAIGLAFLLLPTFNDLIGTNVSYYFQAWHLFPLIGLILLIGLISGIYPAFVLAGFKTIAILAGKTVSRSNHIARKTMVVFQFIATVFLISSTIVMSEQLHFLKTKDLGFDYNAAVSVRLNPGPTATNLATAIETSMEKGELLREKLGQHTDIKAIGMGSHVFGTNGWGKLSFTDDQKRFREFRVLISDPNYFDTFELQIKEGRKFEVESGIDKRQAIILNDAAVKYFELNEPLGKRLPSKEFGDHQIVGVTENFNFATLHHQVEPLIILQNINILMPGISDVGFGDRPIPKLVFKYTGSQLSEMKKTLEAEWAATFPEEELNFEFVSENMENLYRNEAKMGRLVTLSTILAIIIASLGLLGLTLLVVNSKVKEIGIRKVVGASNLTIFTMLSKSLSIQLLLGVLLSIPITYYLMNEWLNDFTFRINIGIDVFLLSGIISIGIALFTVSFNTIKAARSNPVEALKHE